jgi:hypothetical protein
MAMVTPWIRGLTIGVRLDVLLDGFAPCTGRLPGHAQGCSR